jgi:hypothetical protein
MDCLFNSACRSHEYCDWENQPEPNRWKNFVVKVALEIGQNNGAKKVRENEP